MPPAAPARGLPIAPNHRALGAAVEDAVLFDLGGGRLVRGVGPFRRQAVAPHGGWAFYVNDFSLTESQPWLVPARMDFSCEAGGTEVASHTLGWSEPNPAPFAEIFAEIMAHVESGRLRKAVPAVVARAGWSAELTRSFLRDLPRRPADAGTYAYAFQEGPRGFGGRTPEVLLRVENGVLKTMALAGTAPTAVAGRLLENAKLLREHDLVVEVMRERLAVLGKLHIEPRRLLSLGVMTHLCTRFEVTLTDPQAHLRAEELIRLLHPTPALGIAPRTAETLALLQGYRERLGVPAHFGAPVAVQWPGGLLVLVAIRGLFWDADKVRLPTGGGLVQGSQLADEWAELELKQQWVRRALGV